MEQSDDFLSAVLKQVTGEDADEFCARVMADLCSGDDQGPLEPSETEPPQTFTTDDVLRARALGVRLDLEWICEF